MRNVAENVEVSIATSTLHTVDFKSNTVYLDCGPRKYDLLVGADGANSRVRSS